jgi:type-F conjugative transfer system pilin assembly protein TrbC
MISLTVAEDHKAWAMQQQEKSQEFVKTYQQEALKLKSKSVPFKSCRMNQGIPCLKKGKQPENKDTDLYIFISFSLCKETLKALALEAQKHQGILVIRGLIGNSFVKTAKFLQEIDVGVVLDPTLFKEYDVKVVPTFVQKHKNVYQRIGGNISLAYALEKFKGENE